MRLRAETATRSRHRGWSPPGPASASAPGPASESEAGSGFHCGYLSLRKCIGFRCSRVAGLTLRHCLRLSWARRWALAPAAGGLCLVASLVTGMLQKNRLLSRFCCGVLRGVAGVAGHFFPVKTATCTWTPIGGGGDGRQAAKRRPRIQPEATPKTTNLCQNRNDRELNHTARHCRVAALGPPAVVHPAIERAHNVHLEIPPRIGGHLPCYR